jgi:hypothetical protein
MMTQAKTSIVRGLGERLDNAVSQAHQIERFAYYAVSEAKNEEDEQQARAVLQIVTGLRRKLELWRSHG